ncbi:UDP-N-acetylmuramate--L-alanine ligase [Buchananella felis]|uniref:UDP-N-acetylmuramate--L-alanine ligase n=1 Tax=Buchananella felis TaxID=3231492 RepID=UPI0035297B5D
MVRVLLAGGGTAGHVNPMLAVASALEELGVPRQDMVALGTAQGLETTLVPAAGLRLETIAKVPAPRRPNLDALRFPSRFLGAIRDVQSLLRRERIDLVIGMGGYVSTPAYLAAKRAGIPVAIHEQNARPGWANKWGARFAQFVAITFPSTPLRARKGGTQCIGLPLRPAIRELAEDRAHGRAAQVRRRAAEQLGLDPALPTILVTGGSLGAKSINDAFAAAAARLEVQVLHLTGKGKDAPVRQAAADRANYHVLDYLPQMELALAAADLVVCRAGAGTVSELCALGLPAIYVPLPIGNGEQRLNAADAVKAGGALLVEDSQVGVDFVLRAQELVRDAARLEAMGAAAASVGRIDAAEQMAARSLALVSAPAAAPAEDARVDDAAAPAGKEEGRPVFHFIGIGGAGMSVIAELLLAQGFVVSGSDRADSAVLAHLRALGATVHVGHAAGQVPAEATVVVSTAVRESNPELAVARERAQRVWHRSQALAFAARQDRFVAVAGAHGKTTTSAMLAVAGRAAGLDPSWAVGSSIAGVGSGAHLGQGGVFVAEADESDASFLNYAPTVALVTNIEPDHLDHYGTREKFEQAFVDFAARVVPGGTLVLCGDDPGCVALRQRVSPELRVVTYGRTPQAGEHVLLSGHGEQARVESAGQGAQLRLAVPGDHVELNAAGAVAALGALGVPLERAAASLSGFAGTGRRFELRGQERGVQVVDDYAHHPTEVEATLRAARSATRGRVGVLFQPHLYSRTVNFAEQFARALALADRAIVTDVYAAREDPVPGVDGRTITGHDPALVYVADRVQGARELAQWAKDGDLLLTVGAGSITEQADDVLAALRER